MLPEGFDFLLKFNAMTFKYKIHSVKVDLHYLKYLKSKIKCFAYILLIHQADTKWKAESSILVRSMTLDIQILDPTI